MNRRIGMRFGFVWRATALLAALAMALPICVMLGLSLWYIFVISVVADSSTLLAALQSEGSISAALLNSILIAIIVALLGMAGGFGLAAAWQEWLARRRFGLMAICILPSVIPAGALGTTLLISFLFLTRIVAVDLGIISVALGQAIAAAPIAALILHLRWRRIDPDLRRAALEAGATERAVMREITLPLLAPALIAAGMFCLLYSLSDFYLSNSLSGAMPTLSSVVLSGLAIGQSPLYFGLIAVAMIPVIVFAILIERLLRKPIG